MNLPKFCRTISTFLLLTSNSAFAQTPQQNVDAYVQEVKNRVFVLGFWGRDGGGGGVQQNIEHIAQELMPLGIPGDNIYVRPWNYIDDIPGQYPNIYIHISELAEKLNKKPLSYLGITGHSFGGWTASWFSLLMARDPSFIEKVYPRLVPSDANLDDAAEFPLKYVPDYIGLLDPVWYSGVSGPYMKQAMAKDGISYYQEQTVLDEDSCYPQITLCRETDPTSCGHIVEGIHNQEEVFKKNDDGSRQKKRCAIGSRPYQRESHTSIDDSPWLKRLIRERIVADVKALINRATEDAITIYAHDPIVNYWKLVWNNQNIDSGLLAFYTNNYLSGIWSIETIRSDIRRNAVESAFSSVWGGTVLLSQESRDSGDRIIQRGFTRNDLVAMFTSSKINFEVVGSQILPEDVSDDIYLLRPDTLVFVSPYAGYKKNVVVETIDKTFMEVVGRYAEPEEIDKIMADLETKYPGYLNENVSIKNEWSIIRADIFYRLVIVPTLITSISIMLH